MTAAHGSSPRPAAGELNIPTARVFLPLHTVEGSHYGVRGGRGSGKSHAIADTLVTDCLDAHIRCACVREVQSSIKESVKQLLTDKIRAFGLAAHFAVTEKEIRGPNDSLFIFRGLKNHTAESIKSLEGYNRVWYEEAQSLSQYSLEIAEPTFRAPGAKQFYSWNPISDSDPVEKLFSENSDDPDFIHIIANYWDNPWFPAILRKQMERAKRNDPDAYAHIWCGEYRKNSEARVFRNWEVQSFETPADARFYYGADWGFATDPTVLIRCFIDGRRLFVDQEAYGVKVAIDKTPDLFDKVDGARLWPIVADSARPETIDYMQRHGFPRIKPARKGAGSVDDGVEFLKSFDIVVHPRCGNLVRELACYAYKIDRRTQEVLPQLDDKHNHVIDALRYALEGTRKAQPFKTQQHIAGMV